MNKDTSLVRAINKNVRTSPRKLALVCNFIKGKKVDIALRDLEFSRKRIAKDVSKTVKSAISNAEKLLKSIESEQRLNPNYLRLIILQ